MLKIKEEWESNKNSKKKRIAWNKGLTMETSSSLKKASETIKRKYKNGEIKPHMLGKKHTKETLQKMKDNPDCGGYRKGSGRGKSGWYKEYWCDSTYELCWLIYQLDHSIKPIRNEKGYTYSYN
jgi:hypothetical protein